MGAWIRDFNRLQTSVKHIVTGENPAETGPFKMLGIALWQVEIEPTSTYQIPTPIILTAALAATVARIRHIPQVFALRAVWKGDGAGTNSPVSPVDRKCLLTAPYDVGSRVVKPTDSTSPTRALTIHHRTHRRRQATRSLAFSNTSQRLQKARLQFTLKEPVQANRLQTIRGLQLVPVIQNRAEPVERGGPRRLTLEMPPTVCQSGIRLSICFWCSR
jgi:hypothetical protein